MPSQRQKKTGPPKESARPQDEARSLLGESTDTVPEDLRTDDEDDDDNANDIAEIIARENAEADQAQKEIDAITDKNRRQRLLEELEQAEARRIKLQERLQELSAGTRKRTVGRRSITDPPERFPTTPDTTRSPAPPVDKEYTNEHTTKRTGSVKPPKIRDLPVYSARNLQEAQGFIAGAERRFRVDDGYHYSNDTARIDACVLAFDKGPAAKWESFERRVGIDKITWEQFKEWIMDGIQDKANRSYGAATQYVRARQRSGQSTDDFAAYLDSLELEMGITEDAVRKSLLFGKLRDDLRKQISLYSEVPKTRYELISVASRIENSLSLATERRPPQDDTNPSTPLGKTPNPLPTQGEPPKFPARSMASGSNQIPIGNALETPRSSCWRCKSTDHKGYNCPEVTCFKCNKKGHYASKCPELAGKDNAQR